jgi:GNAT superfamily N-acetyltransferase
VIRIRAARRDDFDVIARLLAELGRPELTPGSEADARAVYEKQVFDPDAHHIVAEDERGDVVAFASVHFRARLNHATEEAWVPDLIVTESARRQGIGQALLEEIEQRGRDRGCHMMQLESAYFRAEAHYMYRQFKMRDLSKAFYKALKPGAAPTRQVR